MLCASINDSQKLYILEECGQKLDIGTLLMQNPKPNLLAMATLAAQAPGMVIKAANKETRKLVARS